MVGSSFCLGVFGTDGPERARNAGKGTGMMPSHCESYGPHGLFGAGTLARVLGDLSVYLGTLLLLLGCSSGSGTGDDKGTTSTNVARLLDAEDCLAGTVNGKVGICHATGSTTNSYVHVRVSTKGCISGHTQHPGDFVSDDPSCRLCTPTTCAAQGKNCGTVSDGCGGSLNCGDTCDNHETCQSGVCSVAVCDSGYADCDGVTGNGCETNVATDVNNCGGCKVVCSEVTGGTVCRNGACAAGFCGLSATGSMTIARVNHSATVLTSGKVLIAGGSCGSYCAPIASAELYDAAAGTFSPTTGAMMNARAAATATLLSTGKVLVAGGVADGYSGTMLASTELYDPVTDTFVPTDAMTIARVYHSATLLPSGKVLVAGGGNVGFPIVASAELYDPETGSFSSTAPMSSARLAHTGTLLPSGKVLVAGGTADNVVTLASAELYDPATGGFAPTGAMTLARSYQTATLLPSGNVLIAGGTCGAGCVLESVELYDPQTGTFSPSGNMPKATYAHTATLLLSGKVLVVGGNNLTSEVELYDPRSGMWSSTPFTPPVAQYLPGTTSLLSSGKVLIAGGAYYDGLYHSIASAELYDPGAGCGVDGN